MPFYVSQFGSSALRPALNSSVFAGILRVSRKSVLVWLRIDPSPSHSPRLHRLH